MDFGLCQVAADQDMTWLPHGIKRQRGGLAGGVVAQKHEHGRAAMASSKGAQWRGQITAREARGDTKTGARKHGDALGGLDPAPTAMW